MFSDVLQNIYGIEIYPIVSLLIFVIFFLSVIIWTIKLDKKYINRLSELPLEDSQVEAIDGEIENE